MKTRFIAIFLGLFALTFIGVLAFELRPTEASGFACPSHNSMTSSSTQSASASFGVVTVTYTPPLTDQQIEDAALSACSSGCETLILKRFSAIFKPATVSYNDFRAILRKFLNSTSPSPSVPSAILRMIDVLDLFN